MEMECRNGDIAIKVKFKSYFNTMLRVLAAILVNFFLLILLIGMNNENLFAQSGVGEGIKNRKDFYKIEDSEKVKIELKYASVDNFMKENLYKDFTSCYLHKGAFLKFKKAIKLLDKMKPKWKFILYDCLRPLSIQKRLWDKVKGTSEQAYVGDPRKGSIHNFGFALDLSLLDEFGNEVDMGTGFDDFTPLAEPKREKEFLKAGKLKLAQVENRKILRKIMKKSGFIQRPNEWWHFDGLSGAVVRKSFKIVD